MKFRHIENNSVGEILLIANEKEFDRLSYSRDKEKKYYTIAWNEGPDQIINIDGVDYTFPSNNLIPLMIRQTYHFENPKNIVAWQFNEDFYCILNHDKEVSCIGFLFYGTGSQLFLKTNKDATLKLQLLLKIFIDEFNTVDNIQSEMLRMLLKRLIILTTRLAKEQHLDKSLQEPDKYDLIRKYNFLVEENYKKQHQVQFYARELNKSPKTLANLFAIYNNKSPLRVIHERLLAESKRLLQYTGMASKDIAFELGFEDVAHFNNFFKKNASVTPTEFRKSFFEEPTGK